MAKNSHHSVLSFYQIDERALRKMDPTQIWVELIATNRREASCKNIYSFKISPEQLLAEISSGRISDELLSDIRREYENGANLVFIQPIVGSPLGGLFIEDLISARKYSCMP